MKKSQLPIPIPPDPTVTVTVPSVPDMVRLQQNKLYTVGKLPAVNCKEPAIKPNSQSAILNYYKALLPCLNKAWAPVVKKAGYEFRPPKVLLQTSQVRRRTTAPARRTWRTTAPPTRPSTSAGRRISRTYKNDPLAARVWMMDTLAHEYGHHVQKMTEILTAPRSPREGWTKTKAMKLEWSRRRGVAGELPGRGVPRCEQEGRSVSAATS